jgi:hypothetical protein
MKKLVFACVITLLCAVKTQAQIVQPVTWSYASKKISPNEAVVFIKATIDDGWHIYSQFVKDGGPVKTTVTFKPSRSFTLTGKTIEPKPITKMEKVFNMEVGYFEKSVVFQQRIKLKSGQATVSGNLEYMTCNDQKCLPPADVAFSIPVK